MRGEWCKHYHGVGNGPVCNAGVEYATVVDDSIRPSRWPCTSVDVRERCELFELPSQAELDKRDADIAEALTRMAAFMAHDTDLCPNCNQVVTELRQVGRSVYAYPCGHRLWQGTVPEAWK